MRPSAAEYKSGTVTGSGAREGRMFGDQAVVVQRIGVFRHEASCALGEFEGLEEGDSTLTTEEWERLVRVL
jgi:hypothetical protein